MFNVLTVTLRQGLEAFLIISVALSYLRRTDLPRHRSAMLLGISISVLLSIGAASLFQQTSNQALWKGLFAITATVLVGVLTFRIYRVTLDVTKAYLETCTTIEVLGFTALMIIPKGIVMIIVFKALIFQVQSVSLLIAASFGTLCAASLAWLLTRYEQHLNPSLFFQITIIFLITFVTQHCVYGIHELTEANVLPYSSWPHMVTEPYGADGLYGQYVSYLLVVLPMAWVAGASAKAMWPVDVPPQA